MYELTQLFIYKLQFMAELIIAESLFFAHLKRRSGFKWRLPLALVVSFGFSFALPILSYDPFYVSLLFLSMFLITIFMAYFCYEQPLINIIFAGIAGYTVQHIAYSLFQLFMTVTMIDNGSLLNGYGSEGVVFDLSIFSTAAFIDIYVVTYLVCYYIFGKKIKNQSDFYITSKSLFLIMSMIILGAVILNAVIVYTSDPFLDRTNIIVSFIYNILSCILVLLFQFKLKDEKKALLDLQFIQRLWQEDKQHYELAKENIEIINIKCHDLKHQINAFRQGGKVDDESLDEIEKSIMIYDAMVKTGSDPLDVLLSEKILYCQKHHIRLSYIVDGESLLFLKPSEIYSLFGNAIDNAIEHLLQIEALDQRFIRLTVKKQGGMLLIHIENFFNGQMHLENGLPKSTKSNKHAHGYGLLSIQMICKSYDGELFVHVRDQLFAINMAFPIPSSFQK